MCSEDTLRGIAAFISNEVVCSCIYKGLVAHESKRLLGCCGLLCPTELADCAGDRKH